MSSLSMFSSSMVKASYWSSEGYRLYTYVSVTFTHHLSPCSTRYHHDTVFRYRGSTGAVLWTNFRMKISPSWIHNTRYW